MDDEFDLLLNNGRLLEHFHESNMTYKVSGIKSKTPDVWVEVSRQLAAERKIEDGRLVELTSRHGKVRLRALVTDRVQGHQLYMPMNSSEIAVNRLTGSHTDRATHTPAYKQTAVKMRLLDEVKESPLPRINHRFGTPTPLRGVEVERKWKRPDYRMPARTHQLKIRKKHKKESKMAVPIKFQVPQYDPREELRARLDAAAVEHSEALLEAYEVLQGLHDRGILAALKGALGASGMVLESAVDVVKTPEGIQIMCNLLLLAKLLGSIEPELLGGFVGAIPEAVNKGAQPNASGLLSLAQASAARRPVADWQLPRISWSPLEGGSGRNEAAAIEHIEN